MSAVLSHEEISRIRACMLKTHDLLQAKYGKLIQKKKPNPLDELIFNVLSLNTTEMQSTEAFNQLKKKYRVWESLMTSPAKEISKCISSNGANYSKALRIKRILGKIYKDRQNLSLDFLKKMEPEDSLKYLLKVKGIGSQTACHLLLFSLDKPMMPVNSHIERISKRLGWTHQLTKVEDIQELFHHAIPRCLVLSLYLQMVKHGRVACKVKKPHCTHCVIRQECVYYAQKIKGR